MSPLINDSALKIVADPAMVVTTYMYRSHPSYLQFHCIFDSSKHKIFLRFQINCLIFFSIKDDKYVDNCGSLRDFAHKTCQFDSINIGIEKDPTSYMVSIYRHSF